MPEKCRILSHFILDECHILHEANFFLPDLITKNVSWEVLPPGLQITDLQYHNINFEEIISWEVLSHPSHNHAKGFIICLIVAVVHVIAKTLESKLLGKFKDLSADWSIFVRFWWSFFCCSCNIALHLFYVSVNW